MALQIPWCLACIAIVAGFAMVTASQSQTCSLEKMENITLDIPAAFSKGLRGTDPVYTLSWEPCVSACCSETLAGDKSCNYVVFYPKKKSHSPNCYRFYYPDQEACPIKQAFGLVTYRMIKDQNTARPPLPRLTKLSHPTTPGRLALDLGQDSLPKLLAPQIEPVDGPATLPLGEVGGPSAQPSPGWAQNWGSSTLREAAPADARGRGTPTQPPNARRTRGAVDQAGRAPPQPSALSKAGLTTSGLPAPIPSAPGRGCHPRNGQLAFEDGAGGKEASPSGDQALLLALLCFGVLFLLLVIALMGRKTIDLLRQRQRVQLDYFISDMYAKM